MVLLFDGLDTRRFVSTLALIVFICFLFDKCTAIHSTDAKNNYFITVRGFVLDLEDLDGLKSIGLEPTAMETFPHSETTLLTARKSSSIFLRDREIQAAQAIQLAEEQRQDGQQQQQHTAKPTSSSSGTTRFSMETRGSIEKKIRSRRPGIRKARVEGESILIEEDFPIRKEQDQMNVDMASLRTTTDSGLWGLDRIDQRTLPRNGLFSPQYDGTGVEVIVIDTGINSAHPELAGRVTMAYSVYSDWNDCDGHGTFVAGLIGGTIHGVAPKSSLIAIKTLGCDGTGTLSGLVSGVLYAKDYIIQKLSSSSSSTGQRKPFVINMSLSMSAFSESLRIAIAEITLLTMPSLPNVRAVIVCAASGNYGGNESCSTYPAAYQYVLSVGATTEIDSRASFSSYGTCVDIHAPGTNIESCYLGTGTAVLSGTSMSSGFVSGTAALYSQAYGSSQFPTAEEALLANATTGIISGLPSGTVNKLVYITSVSPATTLPAPTTTKPTLSPVYTTTQPPQPPPATAGSSASSLPSLTRMAALFSVSIMCLLQLLR